MKPEEQLKLMWFALVVLFLGRWMAVCDPFAGSHKYSEGLPPVSEHRVVVWQSMETNMYTLPVFSTNAVATNQMSQIVGTYVSTNITPVVIMRWKHEGKIYETDYIYCHEPREEKIK